MATRTANQARLWLDDWTTTPRGGARAWLDDEPVSEIVPPTPPTPSGTPGIDAMTTSAGFYTFPLKRLPKRRRKRDDEEVILAGRGSTPK